MVRPFTGGSEELRHTVRPFTEGSEDLLHTVRAFTEASVVPPAHGPTVHRSLRGPSLQSRHQRPAAPVTRSEVDDDCIRERILSRNDAVRQNARVSLAGDDGSHRSGHHSLESLRSRRRDDRAGHAIGATDLEISHRGHASEKERDLPKKLDQYALALSHAHTLYLVATRASDPVPALSKEGMKLRSFLFSDGQVSSSPWRPRGTVRERSRRGWVPFRPSEKPSRSSTSEV